MKKRINRGAILVLIGIFFMVQKDIGIGQKWALLLLIFCFLFARAALQTKGIGRYSIGVLSCLIGGYALLLMVFPLYEKPLEQKMGSSIPQEKIILNAKYVSGEKSEIIINKENTSKRKIIKNGLELMDFLLVPQEIQFITVQKNSSTRIFISTNGYLLKIFPQSILKFSQSGNQIIAQKGAGKVEYDNLEGEKIGSSIVLDNIQENKEIRQNVQAFFESGTQQSLYPNIFLINPLLRKINEGILQSLSFLSPKLFEKNLQNFYETVRFWGNQLEKNQRLIIPQGNP